MGWVSLVSSQFPFVRKLADMRHHRRICLFAGHAEHACSGLGHHIGDDRVGDGGTPQEPAHHEEAQDGARRRRRHRAHGGGGRHPRPQVPAGGGEGGVPAAPAGAAARSPRVHPGLRGRRLPHPRRHATVRQRVRASPEPGRVGASPRLRSRAVHPRRGSGRRGERQRFPPPPVRVGSARVPRGVAGIGDRASWARGSRACIRVVVGRGRSSGGFGHDGVDGAQCAESEPATLARSTSVAIRFVCSRCRVTPKGGERRWPTATCKGNHYIR